MTSVVLRQELKYLEFADTLDSLRTKNKINPMEWRTLRIITKSYSKQQPIRIVDLMQMAEIASPATIHKIIKNLNGKGMVEIKLDQQDGRVKYLIPSNHTLKVFRILASRMAEIIG